MEKKTHKYEPPFLLKKVPDLPYFESCGKEQGDFTLEDFEQIPEGYYTELIDGVLYNMPTPSCKHQQAIVFMASELQTFIKSNSIPYRAILGPLDVQLDCDDKTMVEPDLLIVCDREKLLKTHVYGAPDFILEVILPENSAKDMILKPLKYEVAGVREYWILQPKQKRLIVYDFEHEDYPIFYGPEDIVPISVLNNECKIDLSELFEYIEE